MPLHLNVKEIQLCIKILWTVLYRRPASQQGGKLIK